MNFAKYAGRLSGQYAAYLFLGLFVTLLLAACSDEDPIQPVDQLVSDFDLITTEATYNANTSVTSTRIVSHSGLESNGNSNSVIITSRY